MIFNESAAAYEFYEHRPYGAPGEKRRYVLIRENYRVPDGSIACDWKWLIEECAKDQNTISVKPLFYSCDNT